MSKKANYRIMQVLLSDTTNLLSDYLDETMGMFGNITLKNSQQTSYALDDRLTELLIALNTFRDKIPS